MRPHFYPLAALCETGLFLLRKDENTRIQSLAENSLPGVTEAANDTGSQKHTYCPTPHQDPLDQLLRLLSPIRVCSTESKLEQNKRKMSVLYAIE